MTSLEEYMRENEIDEISAEEAFEEGKRLVAREIAFLFGICIDKKNEEKFLGNISSAQGEQDEKIQDF